MNLDLKNAREKKHYRQHELSLICNIALRTYQYYESGERVPDVYTAQIIAKALQTPVEELFKLGGANSYPKNNDVKIVP